MGATAQWGRLVAQRRAAYGMSQRELAERAGISLATVRDLEQGRVREPRADTASRIANALDLPAPGAGLRIQLLGPMQAVSAGLSVTPSSSAQRHLLGVLALAAGQVVQQARLMEVLWSADPPSGAAALLHTHVSRLRRRLGVGHLIIAADGGYRLDPALASVDSEAFQRAYDLARRLGPGEPALAAYADAASLWHGNPVEDLPALHTDATVAMLVLLRQRFALDYADTASALGRHEQVLPLLRRLIETDPLNEAIHERTMAALIATGRHAAAMQLYEVFRLRLADELGVDPEPGLQRLHQQILRGTTASRSHDSPAGPAQLPRPPAIFVGRSGQARQIAAALGLSKVVALHGPGGVGKSALALHAAHTAAPSFPDGRLYVDLQGNTHHQQPLRPADVLARFLRALGTPAEAVPTAEAEAAADYQSLLHHRRVLVLLDNATSADQVIPLLPAQPGCAAIVTSRTALSTLDAQVLPVTLLEEPDCLRLLAMAAGEERIDQEPEAARQISQLCAGLPLALRIAGARLAARADWSMSDLARRLLDEHCRLDELRIDDLAVRSCFEVSYATLTGSLAAQAFRRLGELGLPSFSVGVAAALLDRSDSEAEHAIDHLVGAHLVEPVSPGRYRMHDLIRLFAAETAVKSDSAAGRQAATGRALQWYLNACHQVGDIVQSRLFETGTPSCPVLGDLTAANAIAWLDTEFSNLAFAATAAVSMPGQASFPVELLALVKTLAQKRSHWVELESIAKASLAAARQEGDRAAQAAALACIASVEWRAGREKLAFQAAEQAQQAWREIGDRDFEALSLHNLGWLRWQTGDDNGALADIRGSMRMLEGSARFKPEMLAHNLNEVLLALGRFEEAQNGFEKVLALRRQDGDLFGVSVTLLGLARAQLMRGEYGHALATLDEAVSACRHVGNREDEWHAVLCRSEARLRLRHLPQASADAVVAQELAALSGYRYFQAATARQLARIYRAAGDAINAAAQEQAAAHLFATVTHRGPDVERLFT